MREVSSFQGIEVGHLARLIYSADMMARLEAHKLHAGRVGPPDGAVRESQSHVKATPWPGLAIHDSSRLRELARKWSKKKVLLRFPETFGHQASAMRADVARDRPLRKTRLVGCREMDGENRGGALLKSSVEKRFATSEWWSKSVHKPGPFSR